MSKMTVEIGSKEFKEAVLSVLEESKHPVRKIELLDLRKYPDRFKLLPDGFVLDRFCKIERGPTAPKKMNKADALAYCKSMGCFLEEAEEAESLIDRSKDPCLLKNYPSEMKTDDYYWTNTKCQWNNNASYCVSFDDGYLCYGNERYNFYVRPVRASQC